MGSVRIGCSGWNYDHWRGLIYPRGLPTRLWLEHYATLFDTVEVNATFYRLPRVTSVQRWVEQSPPGFVFAVKASRYLTHVKRLTETGDGVRRFYACIDPLVRSQKMGPVLWQLPPTFKRDGERLLAALAALPSGRHAFEFRHPTWFVPETYDALCAHDVALVVGHDARRDPEPALELTAGFTFVRLHYGARGRRGNYSEREVEEWAERIERWRASVDVYAYFNNDWEGFAVANGRRLRELLGV